MADRQLLAHPGDPRHPVDGAALHEALAFTVEVGKLADLVILERNPLTVDPATIKDIAVLETIKEGRTIYRRDDQRRAAGPGGLEDERPCPHDLAAGTEAPLTSQARETLTLLLGAAR